MATAPAPIGRSSAPLDTAAIPRREDARRRRVVAAVVSGGAFGAVLDNGRQVNTPSMPQSKLSRPALSERGRTARAHDAAVWLVRGGPWCSNHLSERWRRMSAARP